MAYNGFVTTDSATQIDVTNCDTEIGKHWESGVAGGNSNFIFIKSIGYNPLKIKGYDPLPKLTTRVRFPSPAPVNVNELRSSPRRRSHFFGTKWGKFSRRRLLLASTPGTDFGRTARASVPV